MNLGEEQKKILLELVLAAIDGVNQDLNYDSLSDQGAMALSRRHDELYFMARMIEESRQ